MPPRKSKTPPAPIVPTDKVLVVWTYLTAKDGVQRFGKVLEGKFIVEGFAFGEGGLSQSLFAVFPNQNPDWHNAALWKLKDSGIFKIIERTELTNRNDWDNMVDSCLRGGGVSWRYPNVQKIADTQEKSVVPLPVSSYIQVIQDANKMRMEHLFGCVSDNGGTITMNFFGGQRKFPSDEVAKHAVVAVTMAGKLVAEYE